MRMVYASDDGTNEKEDDSRFLLLSRAGVNTGAKATIPDGAAFGAGKVLPPAISLGRFAIPTQPPP